MQTQSERVYLAYKAGRDRERASGALSLPGYDSNALWLELAVTFKKRVREIKDMVFAEKELRKAANITEGS